MCISKGCLMDMQFISELETLKTSSPHLAYLLQSISGIRS